MFIPHTRIFGLLEYPMKKVFWNFLHQFEGVTQAQEDVENEDLMLWLLKYKKSVAKCLTDPSGKAGLL